MYAIESQRTLKLILLACSPDTRTYHDFLIVRRLIHIADTENVSHFSSLVMIEELLQ
jgi:hypothetical protein